MAKVVGAGLQFWWGLGVAAGLWVVSRGCGKGSGGWVRVLVVSRGCNKGSGAIRLGLDGDGGLRLGLG